MDDVKAIKASLEEQLRELTRRAVRVDEELRQPGDDDWAEQAIESADDEVLEEVGDSTVQQIEGIKRALRQIAAGRYGICAKCNRAIARGRLETIPYATLCVKCA